MPNCRAIGGGPTPAEDLPARHGWDAGGVTPLREGVARAGPGPSLPSTPRWWCTRRASSRRRYAASASPRRSSPTPVGARMRRCPRSWRKCPRRGRDAVSGRGAATYAHQGDGAPPRDHHQRRRGAQHRARPRRGNDICQKWPGRLRGRNVTLHIAALGSFAAADKVTRTAS